MEDRVKNLKYQNSVKNVYGGSGFIVIVKGSNCCEEFRKDHYLLHSVKLWFIFFT
jgi:hypothetical protein